LCSAGGDKPEQEKCATQGTFFMLGRWREVEKHGLYTTFFMLAARGAAEDGRRRRDGMPIYPNTKTANLFTVFVFGLMEGGRYAGGGG